MGTACGNCSRCEDERLELLDNDDIEEGTHAAAMSWGKKVRDEGSRTMWNRLADHKPSKFKAVVWKGQTGFNDPNEVLLITGKYDPDHRPKNPVLDFSGATVTSHAPKPTEWMYLEDLLNLTR